MGRFEQQPKGSGRKRLAKEAASWNRLARAIGRILGAVAVER
jgi:hypothetical protein